MLGLCKHRLLAKSTCYWFCTIQTEDGKQQRENSFKEHGQKVGKPCENFHKAAESVSDGGLTQRIARGKKKKKYYSAFILLFGFEKLMLKHNYYMTEN